MNKPLKFFFLIHMVLLSFSVAAAESPDSIKAHADKAYIAEDYGRALALYKSIPQHRESADVCYNLGCTYFRMDSIAQSILWYERALLLSPGDSDIRFSLDMARSRTVDRIAPQHELFLVTWWKKLVSCMSFEKWGYIGLGLFAVTVLFLLLYFVSDRIVLKRIGLIACVLSFLCVILCNASAFEQRSLRENTRGAVVMSPAVTVKSIPSDGGKDLFVIHSGTCVTITDDSMSEWVEIQLSDGKVGWIPNTCVERF